MKSMIKRLIYLLKAFFKIRWIKTFRVNFACLPFRQAIKFPVVVTGKLIIDSLKGRIIINAPIEFGMINIGRDIDNMPIAACPARIFIGGALVFNGHAIINQGTNVCVWESGRIEVGHCVIIASGILLKSACSIQIGDYTRLASGCFVMDTNVHAVKDVETGLIAKNFAPIIIGSHCWLTMNTSVTAGAVIPNFCITARGSFMNKDYRKICDEGTMLGGSPAKPLKNNMRRLFDYKIELLINEYFKENNDSRFYQSYKGYDELEESAVVKQFTIY